MLGTGRHEYVRVGNIKTLISITYEFNSGKSAYLDNSVLPESVMKLLQEEARLEYNYKQRERRRKNPKTRGEPRNFDKEIKPRKKNENIVNPPLDELIRKESEIIFEGQIERLGWAMQQLKPEHQTLIHQLYFQKIKAVDIARQKGVSKEAISGQKSTALKKLKKLMTH